MLHLTCHACQETMEAETEDELMKLGQAHAETHGHTPSPHHILQRIQLQNRGV